MMMKNSNLSKKSIGFFNDKIIGADYELVLLNAKDVSEYLKDRYKKDGIKYLEFNTDGDYEGVAANPPVEIYEYQNFFLMEKDNGDYALLDGFRRLLWYSAPDCGIYVRIYKQKDLTNGQILSLLINLNHFKFYGMGDYHERGFSLLLKDIFSVNIIEIKDAFDAYLSANENATRNDFDGRYNKKEGNIKIKSIRDRILNPFFIDDIKFIEQLDQKKIMVNQFFGILVYNNRQLYDQVFDAANFSKRCKSHQVLKDLMPKFFKAGTNRSAKSQTYVNQVIEIYENLFLEMRGGLAEKSYAEKLADCKVMLQQLQKDKNWTKLTGNGNCHKIEPIIGDMYHSNADLKFKAVIFPNDYESGKKPVLPHGIIDTFEVFGFTQPSSSLRRPELIIGLKYGKLTFKAGHNWAAGYGHSYSRKYTYAQSDILETRSRYRIELFVNIPNRQIW